MALSFPQAKAHIAELRQLESDAVASAQKWQVEANASPNPEGNAMVAGYWKTAGGAAMEASGYAAAYCESSWQDLGGGITDAQGCLDILDGPIGQWDGGKGKRAHDRAFYYSEWANQNEAAAADKAGVPKLKLKLPALGMWGAGVDVPAPTERDPNAVLVDPVTGAVVDPSTGAPVEEPAFLETTTGRVGILAGGAALLYLLYRVYRGGA